MTAESQVEIIAPGEEEGDIGIQLALELERAGGITATALTIHDPTLPWDRWVALGRFFGKIKRSSSWWIGDWINFGEGVYGEKYAAAVEVTGLSPSTLMNYRSVCEKIPASRRVASLPFSMHADVAALKPKEQTKWLKAASEKDWSREELRAAMKEADALPPPSPQTALGEAAEAARSNLEDAAASVARQATRRGGEFVVPAEPMLRLRALLGLGE